MSSFVLTEVVEGGINPELNIPRNVLCTKSNVAPEGSGWCPGPETDKTAEVEEEAEAGGWPHQAVLLLLETYREKRHLFQCATLKKGDVWKIIASEMGKKGYSHAANACMKKWDNLRLRYKIMREKNWKIKKNWIYMSIMDDLLAKDPAVTPPLTIGSLSGVQKATHRPSGGKENLEPATEPGSEALPSSPVTPAKPGTSTDAELPQLPVSSRKRKSRRDSEPPQWFKEAEERNTAYMERLLKAIEDRNDLLKELVNKI